MNNNKAILLLRERQLLCNKSANRRRLLYRRPVFSPKIDAGFRQIRCLAQLGAKGAKRWFISTANLAALCVIYSIALKMDHAAYYGIPQRGAALRNF